MERSRLKETMSYIRPLKEIRRIDKGMFNKYVNKQKARLDKYHQKLLELKNHPPGDGASTEDKLKYMVECVRLSSHRDNANTNMLLPDRLRRELAEEIRNIRKAYQEQASKEDTSCANPDCKLGLVDNHNKCMICGTIRCPHCECIVDNAKHVCDPRELETAKSMRGNCKRCPSCKSKCFKGDGCDNMMCIHCKVFFDWSTLQILKTRVHNPDATRLESLENNTLSEEQTRQINERFSNYLLKDLCENGEDGVNSLPVNKATLDAFCERMIQKCKQIAEKISSITEKSDTGNDTSVADGDGDVENGANDVEEMVFVPEVASDQDIYAILSQDMSTDICATLQAQAFISVDLLMLIGTFKKLLEFAKSVKSFVESVPKFDSESLREQLLLGDITDKQFSDDVLQAYKRYEVDVETHEMFKMLHVAIMDIFRRFLYNQPVSEMDDSFMEKMVPHSLQLLKETFAYFDLFNEELDKLSMDYSINRLWYVSANFNNDDGSVWVLGKYKTMTEFADEKPWFKHVVLNNDTIEKSLKTRLHSVYFLKRPTQCLVKLKMEKSGLRGNYRRTRNFKEKIEQIASLGNRHQSEIESLLSA